MSGSVWFCGRVSIALEVQVMGETAYRGTSGPEVFGKRKVFDENYQEKSGNDPAADLYVAEKGTSTSCTWRFRVKHSWLFARVLVVLAKVLLVEESSAVIKRRPRTWVLCIHILQSRWYKAGEGEPPG
jgi:hypothetical protein